MTPAAEAGPSSEPPPPIDLAARRSTDGDDYGDDELEGQVIIGGERRVAARRRRLNMRAGTAGKEKKSNREDLQIAEKKSTNMMGAGAMKAAAKAPPLQARGSGSGNGAGKLKFQRVARAALQQAQTGAIEMAQVHQARDELNHLKQRLMAEVTPQSPPTLHAPPSLSPPRHTPSRRCSARSTASRGRSTPLS